MKILAIDDNPLILRFCDMVLRKAGYDLMLAPTLAEGLTVLEARPEIRLLLLDAHLQSPTTKDIAERLVARSSLGIILFADRAMPRTLFPANVFGVLAKPFSPASLVQTVQDTQRALSQREEAAQKIRTQVPALNPAMPKACASPALQGNLEMMPVAEILQLLHFQHQTGIFRVQSGDQAVCIFFNQGRIQLATSQNLRSEFCLGRMLLQSQALPPDLLHQALTQRCDDSPPLGEFLVNSQMLEAEALNCALKNQTAGLVFELLHWKKGHFSFETAQQIPALAQRAQLDLSVDELVLEGFQRLDEWAVMEQQIGAPDGVWERTPQVTAVLERLDGLQRRVLEQVNGSTSIGEIAECLWLTRFEVYKAFQHLAAQQIVQRRNPSAPPPAFNA